MAKAYKEIIALFEGLTGKGKLPGMQQYYEREAMNSRSAADREFGKADQADVHGDGATFEKHHAKGLEHDTDATNASIKNNRAKNLIARGSAYKTWKKTKTLSKLQRNVRQGKYD